MQKEKGEDAFKVVVDCRLNATIARAQLRNLCLLGDAINLIIDMAIMLHGIKTGALDMYELNRFYPSSIGKFSID